MRDGPAERSLRGCIRVGVDELPILGCVGEFVDALLIDRQPARHADLLADASADFIEGGDWHQSTYQGMTNDVRAA